MIKKILSYNLNGIRSASNKGLATWLRTVDPDIVCFQELKATENDLPAEFKNLEGYHKYWNPAEKKGYSGVAILSKEKPLHVEFGCGMPPYDCEGRVIRADFPGYSVMSLYLPSGSSGEDRQSVKEAFMADFVPYVKTLLTTHPNLVIAGDYNICHKEIDIHDPVGNKKSSGFLPHERQWLGDFMGLGLQDSFRMFNPNPHQYTWWTFRFQARSRNKGWRIDYQLVSDGFAPFCRNHVIHSDAIHSDHAPIELTIEV